MNIWFHGCFEQQFVSSVLERDDVTSLCQLSHSDRIKFHPQDFSEFTKQKKNIARTSGLDLKEDVL